MTSRAQSMTAFQRVQMRQRQHLSRMAHALRRSGPGKLAGAITHAGVEPEHLVVSGWAALPKRTLLAVAVTLDGRVVGSAQVGEPTPHDQDGRSLCPRSESAGWSAVIERSTMPGGRGALGAVALFDGGLGEVLVGVEVQLPEPPPRPDAVSIGKCDRPADGATVSSPAVQVGGWLRVDQGYDRVEVRIGDGPVQRARVVAAPRPDIAAMVPDPAAPLCGWQVFADVPVVTSTQDAPFTVTAVGSATPFELARGTLRIVPPQDPPAARPERVRALRTRAAAVAAEHRPAPAGLHLLVVTHQLDLGGGQLYLHELLRGLLADQSIRCTVLASGEGQLIDELENWGAQVHVTGPLPVDGPNYEARMLEHCRLVAATDANVVLANTMGSFWGVDLADRCGIPAVWSIHESFPLEKYVMEVFGGRIDAAIESRLRDAFRSAATVVFEADATRLMFESLGDHRRFVRIDYGIDLAEIDRYMASADRAALRRSVGVTPDETLLLCLGTFEPRKAQGSLSIAFARISPEHPDAVLAMIGDNGQPYSMGVREVVGRLGLGSRIQTHAVTDDTAKWYCIADGFVLTSDIESLPRSMLEAMAFGVPVIGSSVFGVPELVTDGVTGILLEPNCLDSAAEGLRRFLALTPAERSAMGMRARELVHRERSAEHYVAAYRRLFEGLAADARALPSDLLGA